MIVAIALQNDFSESETSGSDLELSPSGAITVCMILIWN
jgi:hypothetical protein